MSTISQSQPFVSVFDQVFDVAIYGAGYAGYTAAMQLSQQGKSVLLMDSCGDLLWESGRCFVPATGDSDNQHLQKLINDVKQRGGCDGTFFDGAMAEISATCFLKESDIRALYYVYPVALEQADGLIQSVIVATKSGMRRVVAKQYVDASDRGWLLKLTGQKIKQRMPARQELYMYLQHLNWPQNAGGQKTVWDTQRLFTSQVQQSQTTRQATEQAIASLSPVEQEGVLSHVSYDPYPIFEASDIANAPQGNLAIAAAGFVKQAITTPADRVQLGMNAAAQLTQLQSAAGDENLLGMPITPLENVTELQADVFVAGVGTGGAVAAIAAGQAGAKVYAIDPMSFPGGIGTGGGIHAYYYGVPGGLQDVIDTQTSMLMNKYGQVLSSHRFNPVAKMIVLENLFAQYGVVFKPYAMLCDVTVENGVVTSAIIASEGGPVRIIAKAYIDGTGDGDLCAKAGAEFEMGREGDGIPHAHSQSSGCVHVREHNITSGSRNYDSGWCDPTDADDFTRARITGIAQLQLDKAVNEQRVTYVTPAIGLRQARQIKTDYMITLDDQVRGRMFDDVIGYAGSNYDAHTADYPLESDEGVFWVCLSRSWYQGFVIPMPYRCLLPKALKNVWIASRCLGITQDAHYALRMMRAMQRIGEASGYAAAELAKQQLDDARKVDIKQLQAKLTATGALLDDMSTTCSGWHKKICDEMAVRDPKVAITHDPRALRALESLKQGKPDSAFWLLMKHPAEFEKQVMTLLATTDNAKIRWFSAGIAAMWGKSEAEDVLINVIANRQYGYDRTFHAGLAHSSVPATCVWLGQVSAGVG
jgi:ribulose 1,5-bisphosphate synthetase/thiazole synthase